MTESTESKTSTDNNTNDLLWTTIVGLIDAAVLNAFVQDNGSPTLSNNDIPNEHADAAFEYLRTLFDHLNRKLCEAKHDAFRKGISTKSLDHITADVNNNSGSSTRLDDMNVAKVIADIAALHEHKEKVNARIDDHERRWHILQQKLDTAITSSESVDAIQVTSDLSSRAKAYLLKLYSAVIQELQKVKEEAEAKGTDLGDTGRLATHMPTPQYSGYGKKDIQEYVLRIALARGQVERVRNMVEEVEGKDSSATDDDVKKGDKD